MAEINQTIIDPLNLGLKEVLNALPDAISSRLETLLGVGAILLLILVIYFIVLIISKLLNIRVSRNIIKISNNVEQINQKLDLILKEKTKRNKK